MDCYEQIFPADLPLRAQKALRWKIEEDYLYGHECATSFKDDYIFFALRFYLRNTHSINDIVAKYSVHEQDHQRHFSSVAFWKDMKSRIPMPELSH